MICGAIAAISYECGMQHNEAAVLSSVMGTGKVQKYLSCLLEQSLDGLIATAFSPGSLVSFIFVICFEV